jgi:hypothetical protein
MKNIVKMAFLEGITIEEARQQKETAGSDGATPSGRIRQTGEDTKKPGCQLFFSPQPIQRYILAATARRRAKRPSKLAMATTKSDKPHNRLLRRTQLAHHWLGRNHNAIWPTCSRNMFAAECHYLVTTF